MHHIYRIDTLRFAYSQLKRHAAAGVDGETWRHYGEALEENLQSLSPRLKRGAYRAKPVRRVYIPKTDGRQRPIGITALEDKIVQRATVKVLNAIYERLPGVFLWIPAGRSQHHALDAVSVAIQARKVRWVLDAGPSRVLRYDGPCVGDALRRTSDSGPARATAHPEMAERGCPGRRNGEVEEGAPQGGSISPLLANLYLHYVFDLWVQAWRKKCAHGDVIVVRYADEGSGGKLTSGGGKGRTGRRR